MFRFKVYLLYIGFPLVLLHSTISICAPATGPRSVVKTKLNPSEYSKLDAISKAMAQLDSIHREAWWVLSNEERKSSGASLFGKFQRAAQSGLNIKMKRTLANSCEKYLIEKKNNDFEIYEHCKTKEEPVYIGKAQVNNKNVFVEFELSNLVDFIGIGASILTKKISCRVELNQHSVVNFFSCNDYTQSRSNLQIIKLVKYEYMRDKNNLIEMRGKVYENLHPQRSIDVKVPLMGKITVNEIVLNPPEQEKPKVLPAKTPVQKKEIKKTEKNVNTSDDELEPAENKISEKLQEESIVKEEKIQEQIQEPGLEGHEIKNAPNEQGQPPGETNMNQDKENNQQMSTEPPADLPVPHYER